MVRPHPIPATPLTRCSTPVFYYAFKSAAFMEALDRSDDGDCFVEGGACWDAFKVVRDYTHQQGIHSLQVHIFVY